MEINSATMPNQPSYIEVAITTEPTELYKILKFEGLVPSGGQAKSAVASGQVIVNGKIEVQKRKKIYSGDIVEFEGNSYQITQSKC